MKSETYKVVYRLADYLCSQQRPDGSFPGTCHYGVHYFLALLSRFRMAKYQGNICRCLRYIENFNNNYRNPELNFEELYGYIRKDTHKEFMKHALLNTSGITDLKYFLPGFVDNERVVNWQMLKVLCQTLDYESVDLDALKRVLGCQQGHGAFVDFFNTKGISHQYHNFMAALLAEFVTFVEIDALPEMRGYTFNYALKGAVHYISEIQTPEGNINYVGRGEDQIKGFAVGIYALTVAGYRDSRDKALAYLFKFQRPDGSFPLMLNDEEFNLLPKWYWELSQPGWHDYNCLADYLPLSAFYLFKSAEVM